MPPLVALVPMSAMIAAALATDSVKAPVLLVVTGFSFVSHLPLLFASTHTSAPCQYAGVTVGSVALPGVNMALATTPLSMTAGAAADPPPPPQPASTATAAMTDV